jgi:hypothetical protein
MARGCRKGKICVCASPSVVEQANEISVASEFLTEQKLISNLNRSCCKDNRQDRLKEVNAQ